MIASLSESSFGLAVVDGQHVDAEGGFQRRVLVEVVDENLRIAVALEIDDHAGVLGAFVAHVADAGEDFLVGQICDAPHQIGAVHACRGSR